MTSSKGNIFRVTDPLCREFTGHRWIPRTKASDAELSLICAWTNAWVNNRDAGDLRRHRTHHGVTVMSTWVVFCFRVNEHYFGKLWKKINATRPRPILGLCPANDRRLYFVTLESALTMHSQTTFVPTNPIIDKKSALVLVTCWHQILTSHYLNQWWPRSQTHLSGIILGMGSANERRCHIVTPFLIGRALTENDPLYMRS